MPLFQRRAGRTTANELTEWAMNRNGIEAYLEPANAQHPLSLLLVAGDGESLRRPIGSVKTARATAQALDVPLYDILAVGYPRRMREYATRGRTRTTPPPPSAPGAATGRSFNPKLVAVLALHAGVEQPARPTEAEVRELWKKARARVHPDRNGGDRSAWDAVETAAHALRLL